jgi:hypothetical protein
MTVVCVEASVPVHVGQARGTSVGPEQKVPRRSHIQLPKELLLVPGPYGLGPDPPGLITSWSRALLEKPTVVQLLKNFLTFYATRRFITVFKTALH